MLRPLSQHYPAGGILHLTPAMRARGPLPVLETQHDGPIGSRNSAGLNREQRSLQPAGCTSARTDWRPAAVPSLSVVPPEWHIICRAASCKGSCTAQCAKSSVNLHEAYSASRLLFAWLISVAAHKTMCRRTNPHLKQHVLVPLCLPYCLLCNTDLCHLMLISLSAHTSWMCIADVLAGALPSNLIKPRAAVRNIFCRIKLLHTWLLVKKSTNDALKSSNRRGQHQGAEDCDPPAPAERLAACRVAGQWARPQQALRPYELIAHFPHESALSWA